MTSIDLKRSYPIKTLRYKFEDQNSNYTMVCYVVLLDDRLIKTECKWIVPDFESILIGNIYKNMKCSVQNSMKDLLTYIFSCDPKLKLDLRKFKIKSGEIIITSKQELVDVKKQIYEEEKGKSFLHLFSFKTPILNESTYK